MYTKIITLCLFVGIAKAGHVPLAYSAGIAAPVGYASPVAYSSPAVGYPVQPAVSYSQTTVTSHPSVVAKAIAPVAYASAVAPFAYGAPAPVAAPVAAFAASPALAYSAAPFSYAPPIGAPGAIGYNTAYGRVYGF